MNRFFFFTTIVILYVAGCRTQAVLQYESVSNGIQSLVLQKPISPDQTETHLIVPEGFRVKIFASEPDIRNPMAFTWDERGRLWVVESTNYPHDHIGEEKGGDRITICEDLDGDGKADRFTRFAEDQPLSTAIAIVDGGALVGQAPHIVFMEDLDGDDRYDTKTRVLENAFGTFDSHAVMSNFKYGIDNHIWSAVGYSGMYEPGKAPGMERRRNQEHRILPMGVFRFSRDGSHLEPIGRFNNNTWGVGIGEDNTIYGSTANNNHAVVVGIPLRYQAEMNVANVQSHFLIAHNSSQPLQQVDFRDGYTAAAGAFLYNGRRYPRKYWNALLINEPTGHVVHPVFMEADGAIFKEKHGVIENLLSSSDDWVAPVFSDIGPDENVWVADWYNPVIQHNPDSRGMRNQIWNDNRGVGNAHINPLRDTQHGRVYIIEYTGKEGDPISSLDKDDSASLLKGLRSTNQFWRLTAQRLIVEHQKSDMAADLVNLVKNRNVDEIGLNASAVHALWTLHGLGKIDSNMDVIVGALSHPSPAVRKAALQVLPPTHEADDHFVQANLLQDENLNTRLAAVLRVLDRKEEAQDALKDAAAAATSGADAWIQTALDMMNPAPPEDIRENPVSMTKPGGPPVANVTINAMPTVMSFQQTLLQALEGQPIRLTFNNLHPDLHNVVLLDAGSDVTAFGEALNAYVANPEAINNEYIPPSERDKILASTGVLSFQETVIINIPPLPAGEYVYLCTVPGHWNVMQGVLSIDPLD